MNEYGLFMPEVLLDYFIFENNYKKLIIRWIDSLLLMKKIMIMKKWS